MTFNPYANPYGYLPPNYQGNVTPNIPQNYQNNIPPQPAPSAPNVNAPLQISCVVVQSEQEGRNYPVAPGNNVIFKNETAPYMYSKTMGNSPFDPPVFEKYRLVKEDETESETTEKTEKIDLTDYARKSELSDYAKRSEIDKLNEQIERLKREVYALRSKPDQKSGGQQ